MTTEQHLTRADLARRWNCSTRSIDRLRQHGLIPWIDLTAGRGLRRLVRFKIEDVAAYEKSMRHISTDNPLDRQPTQAGDGRKQTHVKEDKNNVGQTRRS